MGPSVIVGQAAWSIGAGVGSRLDELVAVGFATDPAEKKRRATTHSLCWCIPSRGTTLPKVSSDKLRFVRRPLILFTAR